MVRNKKPRQEEQSQEKEGDVNEVKKREQPPKQPSAATQMMAEIQALRKMVQRGGKKLTDGRDPTKEIADRLDALERAHMTVIEEIAAMKAGNEQVLRGQDIMMTTLRELLHS